MTTVNAVEKYGTLHGMFFDQAARFGDRTALLHCTGEEYEPVTWNELAVAVREVAAGLISIGVKPGDRVGIMSYNRPEWLVSDFAIFAAGAITIPIYHTTTHAQADRLLSRTGTRVAFVSRSEKAEMLMTCSPTFDHIISLDPAGADDAGACSMDYQALRDLGAEKLKGELNDELDRRIDSTGPHDCATILFTSGTTGEPKGVMLSHGNLLSNAAAGLLVQPVTPDDLFLSFLPLSHIFERTIGQYLMLLAGTTIAYSTSIRRVADNITKVRPTVMIGVPRFFEKLHTKVTDAVRHAPAPRQAIFHWAIEIGKKRNGVLASGNQPGPTLNLKYSLADYLVFGKLKDKLGGRLRFFVSGGAPLSADIIEFFLAAGIEILEGYGLTETSPVIATNRLGRIRPGTVGPPLPGVEVKIAEDGEILVRGPSVMLGYYEDEEATAETIQDGWLHTGDLGMMEDGYLRITGRKKEIIVTAGGKNVSPARVENLMIEDDLIAQVMVYGDRRKFLSALVVPDYDRLTEDPASFGLGGVSAEGLAPEKLALDERLNDLIMKQIDERSRDLASFERIKKIVVLSDPFTEESGELTPTMKIKRRVVVERYGKRLDALYE